MVSLQAMLTVTLLISATRFGPACKAYVKSRQHSSTIKTTHADKDRMLKAHYGQSGWKPARNRDGNVLRRLLDVGGALRVKRPRVERVTKCIDVRLAWILGAMRE